MESRKFTVCDIGKLAGSVEFHKVLEQHASDKARVQSRDTVDYEGIANQIKSTFEPEPPLD